VLHDRFASNNNIDKPQHERGPSKAPYYFFALMTSSGFRQHSKTHFFNKRNLAECPRITLFSTNQKPLISLMFPLRFPLTLTLSIFTLPAYRCRSQHACTRAYLRLWRKLCALFLPPRKGW